MDGWTEQVGAKAGGKVESGLLGPRVDHDPIETQQKEKKRKLHSPASLVFS